MAIITRFASEDYVTEQNLIINEQLESLQNNAVLFTPQTLSEEQKAQVRANIGIVDTNNSIEGDVNTETATVMNYVYTYDGDTNSEEHAWVTNYGDIKVFAKMGNIPKGTLNLVGATLFRTNPSNAWLDKTVTITEEHLTDVINKSGEDIPANMQGLIQIFDQHSSDFSKFTILCICTEPGWYNVAFDDWFEIIYFPETGIYGYDKRTYGGNDYLKSFTFSTTVTSSGNSSSEDNAPSSPIHYTGNEIQMFSRGICIGDSVTDGSFDNADGGAVIKRFSYPSILKRLTNIDIANAGIAGATSVTWYDASLNSDSLYGKWVNDEWVWHMNPPVGATDTVSSELNYSNFDFAIIHLGINDLGMKDENVTIEEAINTFEVNINKIISKLKDNSKGIKIFIATIIPSYAPSTNTGYKSLNDKIKSIVESNSNVYLLDLNKYSEIANHAAYNRIHPTALGYHKLADEISSYISYIIHNNLDDFESVQFIGTDYAL